MSPDIKALAAEAARRSRIEQGLPEVCEDRAVLAKVARILAGTKPSAVAK